MRREDAVLVSKNGSTVEMSIPVEITAEAAFVGEKERAGPLGEYFCYYRKEAPEDGDSWERIEGSMQKRALDIALDKSRLCYEKLDYIFAGDLLNQCVGSAIAMRETGTPFFGVYGACSTMGEALALGAMTVSGGFAANIACVTSSHFCAAERAFRTPLEYGGIRQPTSQWTVTAAGCVLIGKPSGKSREAENSPVISSFTIGRIVDAGIKDPANMGAAMAPAAFDTISRHFMDLKISPDEYDLILTGDLGIVGSELLLKLLADEGVDVRDRYNDCGLMIYNGADQDAHAGGSGCGCSAAVLTGFILPGMRRGRWRRVLFCPTGALTSAITAGQSLSIPGICNAVVIKI